MRGAIVLLLASVVGCSAVPERAESAPAHPLDPLTAPEMETAMRALAAGGSMPRRPILPLLVLHEPPKGAAPSGRQAFAVVMDRDGGGTFEAVIDLGEGRVRSWTHVAGAQPNILFEEFDRVPELVRAHPEWRAAMAKRGIADVDEVLIDTWAAGVTDAPGRRLARAIAFHRGDAGNAYGRPIEGVVALVDLIAGRVLEVRDTGVRTVTKAKHDFPSSPSRPAPRPLRVSQPEGVSFTIRGHEVRWQQWVFRYAMHPREGPVLYAVGYEDGGRVRPILHRASLSEMVVPYGDPDANWAWRSAFDEGEYGLGRNANTLTAGREVPENAVFRDAVLADESGAPATIERAVAFYERDGGILWSHYNDETGRTETRRARQLVMMCTVTIGNYDYGLSWVFHQDGTLELEALATGILLAKGTDAKACGACPDLASGRSARGAGDERTGTLVAEHVVAPNHQHFFSARLDFDVDGPANSVAELNVRALPEGEGNAHGNAFALEASVLPSEGRAKRDLSLAEHRTWKVFNPGSRNALGHLAGYMLVPGENSVPHVAPGSATRRRAGFVEHHVWVTRQKPGELSAAGPHPNQHAGGDGLPRWTSDDEPIVNEDVVLWYTLGLTHVPRPEEWPVMPAAKTGFRLVPAGFFAGNPAAGLESGR